VSLTQTLSTSKTIRAAAAGKKKQPYLTWQSGRDMRGISDAASSAEDEPLNYVKFPFIIQIVVFL
jgi:hypothetical protein